jgi:hypothetical protein
MARRVVGGVDTHADAHGAAVIDSNGGILGIESFPADKVNPSGFTTPSEKLAQVLQ